MTHTVLLTGVTGFLGSHTAIQLLEKGYTVIGTLRNQSRASAIRSVIARHTQKSEHLSFVEADLSDEAVWDKATAGVDTVMHIASPFPRSLPKDENDLILPAKQGTLAILKAASKNGVKRVVLTSSTGAIVYGKAKTQRSRTYTEADWTDITHQKDTTPYFRSKTIAERAAWNFIEQDNSALALTTICPGAILGPALTPNFSASVNIVAKPLSGSLPAVPQIGFDLVDVRSVADLHIRAMESPQAAGERFIGSAGFLSFYQIATTLRDAYPERNLPKGKLPNFAVRLISNFDNTLKPILLDLGVERRVNHRKAKEVLGWEPIAPKEAVLACAESLLKLDAI
ncbi:MAG: aldehyde reductase [Cyanobacteria bacterium P01_D01_bin.128]